MTPPPKSPRRKRPHVTHKASSNKKSRKRKHDSKGNDLGTAPVVGDETEFAGFAPALLNAVLGSRGDRGMVVAMARAVSIGKVVRYRDRWRIDLGRAIERAIGARYIYGWGSATSFTNRKVANLVLLRMRAEIAKGGRKPEDVALDFLPAGQHTQVLPRMRKWLEQLQAKAESGDRSGNYTREIERWIRDGGYFEWWRGKSLYAIDEATIEDYGDWLAQQKIAKGRRQGEHLSGKTRRNIMAAFHSFYSWASRRDKRVRGLTWFPWPAVDEPDVQVVSLEERDAVIAQIPERKRGVFLAMRLGAPRPGMAMEILARDFDRRTGMLSLNRARKGRRVDSRIGSTKTRVAWTIPVDRELADWIDAWVPPVFYSRIRTRRTGAKRGRSHGCARPGRRHPRKPSVAMSGCTPH